MDIHSVKIDLIKWLTDLQDQKIIAQIQELKQQQESLPELSDAQKLELKERLEKYERGEMKFSSWDEVKQRIQKKAKDDL